MGNRQGGSSSGDFLEVLARIPWWVGLLTAVLTHVALHALAVKPPAAASGPDDLVRAIVAAVANIAQWIVPLLFVAAAMVSWYAAHHGDKPAKEARPPKGAEVLQDASWQEFENLVAQAFRAQGFEVQNIAVETAGAGDGAVDLVLRRYGETWLVLCKQWKAQKVDITVVREFHGAMAARGAVGGYVITSGAFTDVAKAFAEGRNLKLVDGPKLFAMIQAGRAAEAEKA